jgi:hypothetical protein
MRLQRYITEEEKKNIEVIWDKLTKDCMSFLKELKNSNSKRKQFFYRGTTKKIAGNITKIKTRNDRKPRNTPEEIHNYLDKEFLKKFGWKARSEGVFTTSHSRTGYGESYIFFPIGKYKYIFSTQILDLYSHLGGGYIDDLYLDDNNNIEIIDDAINTYISNNMKRAMETMHETIFKCKEYYMINSNYNDVLYNLIKKY